jgi:hypothetical protein
MYRQSRSMRQKEEDQDPFSTGPTESDSFTKHATYNQIFPVGSSMDPVVFQQQYNLITSFGNYTQTSPVDMTQSWAIPQQSYADVPSTSPVHQGLPTLIPRLSATQSLVSDEGDDTSEPTSPRGEGTERRKEVSWCICRFRLSYRRHEPCQDSRRKRALPCNRIVLAAYHVVDGYC